MLIVAVIALLLFGDRLPEVMRSLGQGIVEFKKGMRGIENAIESAATASVNRPSTAARNEADDREEITAPRFEPPLSEPRLEAPAVGANTVSSSVAEQAASADNVAVLESKPAQLAATATLPTSTTVQSDSSSGSTREGPT